MTQPPSRPRVRFLEQFVDRSEERESVEDDSPDAGHPVLTPEEFQRRVIRLVIGIVICAIVIGLCVVAIVVGFDWLTSGVQSAK